MTEDSLFANYKRAPVAFSHGDGVFLWDQAGREYLDFLGGIAVSSLGHNHPALSDAINRQARRYLHVSNLYRIPEQERAGRRLVEATGGVLDRAFFCNSGAEAVEAAIKLVRRYAYDRDGSGDRHRIVTAEGGFHGRTLGALAATGTPAYQVGFKPLPGGFSAVPFGDLEAADAVIDDSTCAVLIEAIQGEAGVIEPPPGYLEGLQSLCRERGALFVLDEVQTGIGRLGSAFGFQHYGLEPDVITLAKGLGGGVPVGAVLAREEVAAALVPGTHGTTFGGNPLACAAVTAVLRTVLDPGFLERVTRAGEYLRALLGQLGAGGLVTEVRGQGLMIAIECTPAAPDVVNRCLENGLIVNAPRPHSIRMLPPLVVHDPEIERAVGILGHALEGAAA